MEIQEIVKKEIEKLPLDKEYKIDVKSSPDTRQFIQISIGSSIKDSTHDCSCSYLDFWYNEKEKRLEHINFRLEKNLRGKGLGRGLVRAMEKIGRDLDCVSVMINININPSFWEHMGYRDYGEFWERTLSYH